MKKRLLSVVVPVYFEEKGLHEFYRRTKAVLQSIKDMDHEIILVNDGSTDKSWDILQELQKKDKAVKIINFSRNFGHQIAITAGMDHAMGDAVVIIDDDLQDPPEVIIDMVKKWNEGFEVVYGVRIKRKGETALKLITASLFYKILSFLSNVDIPLNVGDFRLLDRKVVVALTDIREENRYIRGLISWIGYKQFGLPYERDVRYAGTTTYTLKKLFRFAFDGILSFSDMPLKLSSVIGLFTLVFSLLYIVIILVHKIIDPGFAIQGWTSLMVVVLFMGGLQMLSLGIIGQYISRIYSEVKNRPLYIIADKNGFNKSRNS